LVAAAGDLAAQGRAHDCTRRLIIVARAFITTVINAEPLPERRFLNFTPTGVNADPLPPDLTQGRAAADAVTTCFRR
jgi:hypothetical protein